MSPRFDTLVRQLRTPAAAQAGTADRAVEQPTLRRRRASMSAWKNLCLGINDSSAEPMVQ
jgi:hypothetical protein